MYIRGVGKYEKLLLKILSGTSDANIRFNELQSLMKRLGFEERIKGSHHIYYQRDMLEIINIQQRRGLAKAYQVKQIREIIKKYDLKLN